MKHLRLVLTLCVLSASAYLVYNHGARWLGLSPKTVVQPVQPHIVIPPQPVQEEATPTAPPPPANPQVLLNAHTEQAVVAPPAPKPVEKAKATEPTVGVAAPKPAEVAKPVEAKPVEAKPVEVAKPVEPAKPAETAKPVESASPVEVAKPMETPKLMPAAEAVKVPPAAPVPAKVEAIKPAETPKVAVAPPPKPIQLIIKEIKFTGVTLVSEIELKKTVAEFIGKELTVQEAFAIPGNVASHYKRNNLMAIATLVGALTPEGVLTVGVTEMPMTQSQAEKELATIAPAPVPMQVPLPTPTPNKKDADSETDYILKNYAKKSRQYELMVDNYGPDATGNTRIGAALSVGGDQLSLVGFKSQGSEYLRMAANWITGIDGLKIGAHVANLKYEVVHHLQTAMYQSGDAVKRGVSLIYELVNETSHLSTLALKFDAKSSHAVGMNFADSTAFQSWVSNLEYKGIVREMIPGGAVFSYDLTYAQGHVDVTGATNIGGIEVDEGPFSKIRFSGSLMQPLGGLGSVYAGLSLQRSRKNLDPSERFYLGGPTGVRAYGVGEGYGSEGELATLEFRQRLGASTVLSEFYDWGRVRLTHDRAAANNATTLSGYGISLSQEVGNGTTLKGTWARSTGNNTPLPLNPNGHDNADRNRFWLSMETRF